jgi:hypothetical protein
MEVVRGVRYKLWSRTAGFRKTAHLHVAPLAWVYRSPARLGVPEHPRGPAAPAAPAGVLLGPRSICLCEAFRFPCAFSCARWRVCRPRRR